MEVIQFLSVVLTELKNDTMSMFFQNQCPCYCGFGV